MITLGNALWANYSSWHSVTSTSTDLPYAAVPHSWTAIRYRTSLQACHTLQYLRTGLPYTIVSQNRPAVHYSTSEQACHSLQQLISKNRSLTLQDHQVTSLGHCPNIGQDWPSQLPSRQLSRCLCVREDVGVDCVYVRCVGGGEGGPCSYHSYTAKITLKANRHWTLKKQIWPSFWILVRASLCVYVCVCVCLCVSMCVCVCVSGCWWHFVYLY